MATRTISNAGGNYNATGTWVEGAVPTNADDVVATATSGNLTVTATAAAKTVDFTNYVGTFVINTSQNLTVSGSVTLVSGMTWTASTGTLTINATATLTSNAKPIPCALTCTAAGITITLGDNVTVNGLVTTGNASNVTFNGNTLTCAGGHTCSSTTQGTTSFKYTGGSISSGGQANALRNMKAPFEVAGNIALGNHFIINGTGTYTSGTINFGAFYIDLGGSSTFSGPWPNTTRIRTLVASTLTLGQSQTINTLDVGVTGNTTLAGSFDLTTSNTIFSVSTGNIVLNRATHSLGDIVLNTGIAGIISGAYDVSATGLMLRTGSTLTLQSGQIVTVSSTHSVCGCMGATTEIKSSTPSTPVTITFSGGTSNVSLYRATLTDITYTNACYSYFSGTLTRTSGVTDFTSNPGFYSDPGVSLVKTGTAYKYNSETNNRTGTYDGSDLWSDPGVSNVALGVEYKANSATNNRTGTVTTPTAGQVKTGVQFGASLGLTGTYDGSDRWTDPGVDNVAIGVEYKANSTSNNRTGTVTAPTEANVKSGITFGPSLSLTGTYNPIVPLADVKLAAETVNINNPAPTPSDPPSATDYLYAVLSGEIA